ncbi:MAG: ATP-binding cassette domain-containing protein [Caldilineaceae bacterium]
MIEVQNLSKFYGDFQALKDVSFSVNSGEIVGLLGPNGAGKSTIIKTLTGYLQPDEGSVNVDGIDVLSNPQEVQSRIGYLPENAPLYPELTVQSYLRMMADLREIPESEQKARLSEAIKSTGLQDRMTQLIGTLSKGYRQRVGLAQAILHRPKLLILDEPSVGLDPTQIVEIRNLIRRLAEHSTILFSSHILPEVEALCNRAIIIMNGEVRADADLDELRGNSDAVLVLDKEVADAAGEIKKLVGVRKIETMRSEHGHPSYRIVGQDSADLCPAVFKLATQNNWPVRELRSDRQTLETVFNQLASGK